MKEPGEILLVACYELGHQPLAVAWPAAFFERAGYRPAVMDLSVEPFDADRAARAKVVAISVPMHTALRLGVTVAERVRAVNPGCHVCFFGLYAGLNAEYLFAHGAQSVISGEAEAPLVDLVQALEAGDARSLPFVQGPGREAAPHLRRLDFALPSRAQLPPLKSYAHLERGGRHEPVGSVAASRGCLHLCRHCPIPPVYGGRFFAVPADVVLADIRQQVAAGARHITFGDPDFLNGPTHALRPTREAGIELRPTWVAFTPWTRLEDYRELLDFIEAEGIIDHVDPVQYSLRLLVPPGSLLLQSPALRPYLGALEQEIFSYRWTHPDPRMDRLQEAVAAAVAGAAERGEDAALTFDRVRGLADEAAGEARHPSAAALLAPDRPRPPRLTEPWFC